MMFRTHLAIGVFASLVFLPLVDNPFPFVGIVVLASLLPDIDTPFSKVGRNVPAKIVQVGTEHRGLLHSLTFAGLISLLISVFYPVFSFGFFLGYSTHLIGDAFTKKGITPFWPYSRVAKGVIPMNGVIEKGIFFTFVMLDVLFVGVRLLNVSF